MAHDTDDPSDLHRIIDALSQDLATAKAGLVEKSLEVEKLKIQLARLRRMQFGRSSERIDREIAQLELLLEEQEISDATLPRPEPEASREAASTNEPARKTSRHPLPAHLPRTEIVHASTCACAHCGGVLRKVGEDVTEVLDYVPGRFEVIRHVRPAFSCRTCERMIQDPMPSLPIERGRPGPGLLAHVLVGKFADHLPLHRQVGIYAREGVDLDRATLAFWVGKSAALLSPLVEAVGRHVMAGAQIHADDTPVPVLAPGVGKTRTGRLWVYLRDERPHGGSVPPAAFYRYSPDRKGERPREHLKDFRGFLHADGYSGFAELYQPKNGKRPAVIEVGCFAHARRKLFDVHEATGSPIARQALERIGDLFAIEREIMGRPPDERRRIRQARASPILDDLSDFFDEALSKLPGRGSPAGAIRYARSRWAALTRYVDHGELEISNNAAERAIRPLALGRKNYMFLGSDAGGERAAAIYTLVETAKLNGLDPEAYLSTVLSRIADHPISRIDEFLPWNCAG